jgi:hypothetical protein
LTISFENDNDFIVYTLERIVSYARKNEHIFLAQCIWWITSVIGLQQGLVIYIDNLKARALIPRQEEQASQHNTYTSAMPRDIEEDLRSREASGNIDSDRRAQVEETIQEDSRSREASGNIHPDRRAQVEETIQGISDLDLNNSEEFQR